MSVSTTASQKIEEAKTKIGEAYKALLTVVDEDTYGHSDYKESYISNVHEVIAELLKLKRKL